MRHLALLTTVIFCKCPVNQPSEFRRKDEILKQIFDSNPKDWTYSDEDGLYYHSSDIYLQIREIRSDEIKPFNEPWVKSYADPNANQAIFSISYDKTEIEKYYFASVDGSRMFIPYPKAVSDLRITQNQYLFGKIINFPWEVNGGKRKTLCTSDCPWSRKSLCLNF